MLLLLFLKAVNERVVFCSTHTQCVRLEHRKATANRGNTHWSLLVRRNLKSCRQLFHAVWMVPNGASAGDVEDSSAPGISFLVARSSALWAVSNLAQNSPFLLSFIFSDSFFVFCFVLFVPSAFPPYTPGPYCAFLRALFLICQTSYAVLLSEVLGKDVLSCLCSGACSCWSVSGCVV